MRIALHLARVATSVTALFSSSPRRSLENNDHGIAGSALLQKVLPELQPGSRRLYLCRHGETAWNSAGRIQGGGYDLPLNSAGRTQAAVLASSLSAFPLQVVASSHLERAEETANAVVRQQQQRQHAAVTRIISPKLGEMRFGDFEGVALAEDEVLRNHFLSYKEAMLKDMTLPWPAGESTADVQRRGVNGLQQILRDFESARHICLVGHGRWNKILLHSLLRDHSPESAMAAASSHQGNSCINVLDMDAQGRWTLRLLGFVDHVVHTSEWQ
jgi:broad specificity phosphatase PhoE